jgi:subfamily B ATP-binding cassette protein MsbA
VVAIVSMALVAAATVFAYNLIRPVYDQVLRAGPVPTSGAEFGPGLIGALDRLAGRAQQALRPRIASDRAILLLLILVAVAIKNLFTFVARYAVARLGLATIRDLRDRLFDALLVQSPSYFHGTSSGILISRVVNDVQLINEALAERFGDLLQDLLTVAVLLVFVVSLDPRLAAATLVLAPVLLAPVIHFSRRLRRRSRQSQERMGDLTTVLDETVKGIRIVQAYGMERFESDRFRTASQRHFWANLKARAIQAANGPVMEVVGAGGAVALIAYASRQITAGTMTLGDFSAFLLGIYGAYNPIKRLNKFNLALQQAEVASQRVFEVIDAPVAIVDSRIAVELTGVGDGIRLDNVSFAYAGEPVLHSVTLHVPAGTTVALVGPSGAGKSTVAQLIPRFWDVQHGSVRVGGHDVREVTLRSLRSLIGLVTQETVLFNDTVHNNIAFGREAAPRPEVEAAARSAFAAEFIRDLPRGYDTKIGEGGMTLSGGQRQRLAIARALHKDPPILILDEATSALDPEAERLVQRALDNLVSGRTTLVIAHRLSTVRRADSIVVMDGGSIVDRGTHDELMERGGLYRRMVEMQELRAE